MSIDGVPALDIFSPLHVARNFAAQRRQRLDALDAANANLANGNGGDAASSSTATSVSAPAAANAAAAAAPNGKAPATRDGYLAAGAAAPLAPHEAMVAAGLPDGTALGAGFSSGGGGGAAATAEADEAEDDDEEDEEDEEEEDDEEGCDPAALLPPVVLIHGTADQSVPYASSTMLHQALVEAGADSTCQLVEVRRALSEQA